MDVTLELEAMEDYLDKPAARTEWDRKVKDGLLED
jgi:hypothetical protein